MSTLVNLGAEYGQYLIADALILNTDLDVANTRRNQN